MSDNIERILELVDSYCNSINDRIKNSIRKYDDIIETDDAIQLYVRKEDPIQLDLFLYAIIELGIEKKLELYEKMIPRRDDVFDEVYANIKGTTYVLRRKNYIVSLKHKYHLLRAIFFAERFNSLNLFRKLLEIGYIDMDTSKVLLQHTSMDKSKVLLQHISNVEFRIELINYIKEHSNDNGDCDIGL